MPYSLVILGVIIPFRKEISLQNAKLILFAKDSSFPKNHPASIIFFAIFIGSKPKPNINFEKTIKAYELDDILIEPHV